MNKNVAGLIVVALFLTGMTACTQGNNGAGNEKKPDDEIGKMAVIKSDCPFAKAGDQFSLSESGGNYNIAVKADTGRTDLKSMTNDIIGDQPVGDVSDNQPAPVEQENHEIPVALQNPVSIGEDGIWDLNIGEYSCVARLTRNYFEISCKTGTDRCDCMADGGEVNLPEVEYAETVDNTNTVDDEDSMPHSSGGEPSVADTQLPREPEPAIDSVGDIVSAIKDSNLTGTWCWNGGYGLKRPSSGAIMGIIFETDGTTYVSPKDGAYDPHRPSGQRGSEWQKSQMVLENNKVFRMTYTSPSTWPMATFTVSDFNSISGTTTPNGLITATYGPGLSAAFMKLSNESGTCMASTL